MTNKVQILPVAFATVLAICLQVGAQDLPPRYIGVGTAENSGFAKLTPGGANSKNAYIELFEYSLRDECFQVAKRLDLPHPIMPVEILRRPNSQQLVMIGNFISKPDPSGAITMIDFATNKMNDIKLDQLFSAEEIKEMAYYRPAGYDWNKGAHYHFDTADNHKHLVIETTVGDRKAHRQKIVKVDLDSGVARSLLPSSELIQMREMVSKLKEKDRLTVSMLTVAQEHLLSYLEKVNQAPPHETRFEQLPMGVAQIVPGALDSERHSEARVLKFDRERNIYRLYKTIKLKNKIMPQEWFFTPDLTYLVTFDEFDSIGSSQNTLVIYDITSGKSKAFSLEDCMPVDEIGRLEQHKTVRLWRIGFGTIEFKNRDYWMFRGSPVTFAPLTTIDLDNLSVNMSFPAKVQK